LSHPDKFPIEVLRVLFPASWFSPLRLYTSGEGFVVPKGGTEGTEFVTYTRTE